MINIGIITDTGTELVLKNPDEQTIQQAKEWEKHTGEAIIFTNGTEFISALTCHVTAVMVYETKEYPMPPAIL